MKKFLSMCLVALMLVSCVSVVASAAAADWVAGNGFNVVKLNAEGKTLDSVIAALQDPADEKEIRIPIVCEEFGPYGDKLLADLEEFVKATDGLSLEVPNYEGVRINFPDGWCLLRKSLHDPILPMNMAADTEGGCVAIQEVMAGFLNGYDQLDLTVIK